MNNTTAAQLNLSEYGILVERSLATLKRTTPSAIGLIATGLLAVVTNIVILVLIKRTESLRTPSHFLIGQLAFADWLVGLSYVVTGIKRLVRFWLSVPEVSTQLHCCAEMFPLYFSSTKLIANCFITSSVTQRFYTFGAVHKPALVCIMMALYGVVMLSVHLQVKSARKRNENVAAVREKIEANVARMLAVMGSLYLVTQIVTRCGMALLGLFPPHVRPHYSPFIRMLMIVNSGINIFVYVGLSSEYKNAFRTLLGKPSNVSAPGSKKVLNNKVMPLAAAGENPRGEQQNL